MSECGLGLVERFPLQAFTTTYLAISVQLRPIPIHPILRIKHRPQAPK